SFHLVLVELGDRLLRVVVVRHLDERKPPRATGRHVPHHPDVVHLARPAEQLGELILRGGIREVADVESPAHAVTYSWLNARLRMLEDGPPRCGESSSAGGT